LIQNAEVKSGDFGHDDQKYVGYANAIIEKVS
jgi:hypothetical protein